MTDPPKATPASGSTLRIALDTTPLGLLSHPNRRLPAVVEVNTWLQSQLAAGVQILIPEIADYEVRRELLRVRRGSSIARLDNLQNVLIYLPLDTAAMRRAAEFWARARQQGTPTADPREIDADVILAAQAEAIDAVVTTVNVGHLAQFVDARHWRDIPVPRAG